MSSPKSALTKPGKAKTSAASPAKAAPRAVKAKPASDDGMTGQDKANFIKAMMEGVGSKGAAKRSAPAEAPKKVEILRRISAPVAAATPSNPMSDEALALAARLEAKFAEGEFEALTPEATQALVAAICKLYSARAEAGDKFPIVRDRFAITGTDAMIACGSLLKAVDLQVFELGMWQSWSGI
jgi:hypothetical protein